MSLNSLTKDMFVEDLEVIIRSTKNQKYFIKYDLAYMVLELVEQVNSEAIHVKWDPII